ncbi:uncharacterized protein C2845_PMPSC055550 [Panicum miliaceum]|uniref:Uncharacterized protein n=1 Tax=Panicum miliaceum TaxID=4540 RepID=A0A3L6PB10_PANMI|nr:uncharacterized protein C2845_PMPSC055550 [Panicum miliaceum]
MSKNNSKEELVKAKEQYNQALKDKEVMTKMLAQAKAKLSGLANALEKEKKRKECAETCTSKITQEGGGQVVMYHAAEKIAEKECGSERAFLTPEEEDIVFQSTYKQSTGCKTDKLLGHGYMAKFPTRSQLMTAKLEEQARASAAAQQKNIEVQGEVEKLKEKLANLEAERYMIIEESKRQIQQEEEKKRQAFKEALREELRQ